jgi:hypothetical protein
MSNPNYFQKRFEWHVRCVEFEKKYQARPVLVDRPVRQRLLQQPVLHLHLKIPPTEDYTNKIEFTSCDGKYLVILTLDNQELYEDIEETLVFELEEDAHRCFKSMIPLKNVFPTSALRVFQSYGCDDFVFEAEYNKKNGVQGGGGGGGGV